MRVMMELRLPGVSQTISIDFAVPVCPRQIQEAVMGFSTDAIHVGQEPDPATGAVVLPIYQTSTYVLEAMDKSKGYDYARTNHPNRKALERTVAKLEGGQSAYVFTSGMAAIDSVFRSAASGRPHNSFASRLRRSLSSHHEAAGRFRTRVQLRRHRMPRESPASHQAEHENALC